MTLARAKVVRGARRRQGGRPRPGLPPGPQRLPRPLRARRGPAAAAQPEPRPRRGVLLRRAAQPDPRRRAGGRRPRDARHAARRAARRRPRAGRQGPGRAGAGLRLLLHDPLPRGRRGRAADRDPARLAGGRAGAGLQAPARARRARRGRRDGGDVGRGDVVLDLAPVNRELLEAITALAAVAVLVLVSFWLVARLEHRRRMEFMRARTAAAIAAGIVGGVRRRSGSRPSTARGSRRCSSTRRSRSSPRASASGSGSARPPPRPRSRRSRWAILRLGAKLPLKPMLLTGASILLLLSVAFAGNAVRSLQEADMLAVTPVRGELGAAAGVRRRADRHPPHGAGPRRPGGAPGVFVLGAAWVFAAAPRCGGGAPPPRSARHDRGRGPARRRRRRRHLHEGGRRRGAHPSRCGPTPSSPRATTPPRASSRASRGRCASCSTRSAPTAARSSSSRSRRRRR